MNHIVIDARNRRSSTGRYTDRLITHLEKIDTGNRYTVLTEATDDWKPTSKNFSRQVADFKQFSFNPFDQIRFAWQLYRLKPDLVHFTMTQQPLLYFGNIVTTTHDLTPLSYKPDNKTAAWLNYIQKAMYRTLIWFAHRKSKKIIVPTSFVAQEVNGFHSFTKQKTVVTYEASEPPLDIAASQPKNVSGSFILYVGRAFPHKNLQRLLDAFEKVEIKNPNLKLIFAGKKEFYYEELEQLASKKEIAKSIIFTDFVSDAELKWLYENALAYVFPSLSEGFGLPGLEAMVHGCPLVSSNATCLPEVYGDAAVYFDPSDVEDMAAHIHSIINDSALRKKLITAGHKKASKYSWRRMAKQTLDVYASVLKD